MSMTPDEPTENEHVQADDAADAMKDQLRKDV
ncbi:MAG: hypothetical protein QOD93_6542, partial [Acetobacteraceae bacterium]|nr:hypothetical protein [Acetobacteraceae bacterium]